MGKFSVGSCLLGLHVVWRPCNTLDRTTFCGDAPDIRHVCPEIFAIIIYGLDRGEEKDRPQERGVRKQCGTSKEPR
jgi:hypothetical protein